MARYSPAIDKALLLISSMLSEGKLRPGDTLPSIRQLSRASGVCTVSVARAVAILRRQGTVKGEPGKRPLVAGASDERPPLPAPVRAKVEIPQSSVSRIEADLRRRILLGEINSNSPFPSVKELHLHFRASHRTIGSVLARLHTQGLVNPYKRWYRVKALAARRSSTRAVLVGFSNLAGGAIIRGHHDSFVLGALQTEFWRRNVNLVQAVCPLDSADILEPDGKHRFGFPPDILGYVVLLNQRAERGHELLSRLAETRLPVAVVDELGDWSVENQFSAPGRVRVFAFSSGGSAAAEVVRVLLDYGHRRFAYITPYKGQSWSTIRRDAVREELSRAGLGGALDVVEFDVTEENPEVSRASHWSVLDRCVSRMRRQLPREFRDALPAPSTIAVLALRIHALGAERILRPLLKRLADRRAATAWIAVNDDTALIVKSVFQQRGIAVPDAVSLASFDNTVEAQDAGIASYDFNATGLVSSVVNYLMLASDAGKPFPAERVEIPGILIGRRSIGPAPG